MSNLKISDKINVTTTQVSVVWVIICYKNITATRFIDQEIIDELKFVQEMIPYN